MSLREDVAEALFRAMYGPDPSAAFPIKASSFLDDADAAIGVISQEYVQRIEVALGRVNEVRLMLSKLEQAMVPNLFSKAQPLQDGRDTLLAAIAELQQLLPAERAAEWGKKL